MKPQFLTAVAASTFAIATLSSIQAEDYTYSGTGDWYDDAGGNPNWSPELPVVSPNLLETGGNTVTIVGAVNYNATDIGDLRMGQGDTMTIDGGSWTQAAATGNWVKIGTGGASASVIIKNGGTLNMLDTDQQFRVGLDGGPATLTVQSTGGGITVTSGAAVGAGSAIHLQGGTNSFANLGNTGAVSLSGGANTFTTLNNEATLSISGGTNTFSTLGRSSTSALSISGGTTTVSGNFIYKPVESGSFMLTGGVVTFTGEFKPIADFTMAAGRLNSTLISFADGPGTITLTGGILGVDGANVHHGIYPGVPGQSVNFSLDSTGALFFANTTIGQLNSYGFLTNGLIQLGGSSDTSSLIKMEADGGVYVSVVPIPEPSTVLLMSLGGLGYMVFLRRRRA